MNRLFLGLVLLPLAWAAQGPTYDTLKSLVVKNECSGSGAEFVVCGADTVWDSDSNLCKTDPTVLNDAAHNQRLKLAMLCRAWCYTLNQDKISDCKWVCNHLNNEIHTYEKCMSKSSENKVKDCSVWPDNLVDYCGLSENEFNC